MDEPLSITVKHEFAAGHRIADYTGRCSRPHGHNYRIFVTVVAPALDANNMVMDFGDLKRIVEQWITDNWDHAFLADSRDKVLINGLSSVPESRVYTFESAKPTAETLARHLGSVLRDEFGLGVACVQVWETDRQYAEANYAPADR